MYNLTANEEYCEMFPDKVDRLDLHVISNRNKERHYDGAGGLLSLFNDLERMCENGKAFNSSNQGFQPWTLVDMMEKTIENLKTTLAGGIQSSTLGSSASDRASSRNAISLTAEMNEESATDDPYEEEERIATQLEVASQLEEV